MQPEQPLAAQWEDIRTAVFWLFVTVGFVILCAGSLLAGLAIVPSAATAGELPEGALRVRWVFLGIAVLALVGAVFAAIMLANHASVIYDIWGRVWI